MEHHGEIRHACLEDIASLGEDELMVVVVDIHHSVKLHLAGFLVMAQVERIGQTDGICLRSPRTIALVLG